MSPTKAIFSDNIQHVSSMYSETRWFSPQIPNQSFNFQYEHITNGFENVDLVLNPHLLYLSDKK
jgi:hypothetical protein